MLPIEKRHAEMGGFLIFRGVRERTMTLAANLAG